MLEWFYPDPRSKVIVILIILALGMLVYTVKDWGFSWVTNPWLWLVLAPFPFVVLLFGVSRVSAGADWVRVSKHFVKTYELTSVEVTIGAVGSRLLGVVDRRGNGFSVQLGDLQDNFELWDLVYNGILHSVHVGGAETNKRAWEYLDLEFPPHLTRTQ